MLCMMYIALHLLVLLVKEYMLTYWIIWVMNIVSKHELKSAVPALLLSSDNYTFCLHFMQMFYPAEVLSCLLGMFVMVIMIFIRLRQ